MAKTKKAAPRAVPAAAAEDQTRLLPGESYADYEARMVRLMTPHTTGSTEEYREAARRYVIDFAMWLDRFLSGVPCPEDCIAMPAFRVASELERREVLAWFAPMLKQLRGCTVEENPIALDSTSAAAAALVDTWRASKPEIRALLIERYADGSGA